MSQAGMDGPLNNEPPYGVTPIYIEEGAPDPTYAAEGEQLCGACMGLTADFYKGKALLPRETKSRFLKISKRVRDLQDLSKSTITIISKQPMGNQHSRYSQTRKLKC